MNGSSGGRLITTNNTLTFCWTGWLATHEDKQQHYFGILFLKKFQVCRLPECGFSALHQHHNHHHHEQHFWAAAPPSFHIVFGSLIRDLFVVHMCMCVWWGAILLSPICNSVWEDRLQVCRYKSLRAKNCLAFIKPQPPSDYRKPRLLHKFKGIYSRISGYVRRLVGHRRYIYFFNGYITTSILKDWKNKRRRGSSSYPYILHITFLIWFSPLFFGVIYWDLQFSISIYLFFPFTLCKL